ncbi:hypothetical protein C8R44DRAFT_892535 [Mycena epipterygia]|nr:hypothetical protein C8R44DRAFT_892535 [Mycena epipterygia]
MHPRTLPLLYITASPPPAPSYCCSYAPHISTSRIPAFSIPASHAASDSRASRTSASSSCSPACPRPRPQGAVRFRDYTKLSVVRFRDFINRSAIPPSPKARRASGRVVARWGRGEDEGRWGSASSSWGFAQRAHRGLGRVRVPVAGNAYAASQGAPQQRGTYAT